MKQKLYEAMFLIDAAKGGSELPSLIRHISGLLQRHDALIERIEKWDERKLAYKIKGVDRGIYILVHFRAEPGSIAEVRRAIRLSEEILRVLILSAEEVPETGGELYSAEGEQAAPAPTEEGGAEAGEEKEEEAEEEEDDEEEDEEDQEEGEQEEEEEQEEQEEAAVGAEGAEDEAPDEEADQQ